MIGTTLSHYVVEVLLGEGGMGAVYRARDTVLNRTVAIKVLTTEAIGDAESKRRLLNEARAASALNHSNIVTIYAVEQEHDINFIVWLEGTKVATDVFTREPRYTACRPQNLSSFRDGSRVLLFGVGCGTATQKDFF
jgi:serine/threonine protein kinase